MAKGLTFPGSTEVMPPGSYDLEMLVWVKESESLAPATRIRAGDFDAVRHFRLTEEEAAAALAPSKPRSAGTHVSWSRGTPTAR